MARTAKQVAAQRKASLASARARKAKANAKRLVNKHGIGGKSGAGNAGSINAYRLPRSLTATDKAEIKAAQNELSATLSTGRQKRRIKAAGKAAKAMADQLRREGKI